jgi:hypothetical protein
MPKLHAAIPDIELQLVSLSRSLIDIVQSLRLRTAFHVVNPRLFVPRPGLLTDVAQSLNLGNHPGGYVEVRLSSRKVVDSSFADHPPGLAEFLGLPAKVCRLVPLRC